jgi:hypothetical protein
MSALSIVEVSKDIAGLTLVIVKRQHFGQHGNLFGCDTFILLWSFGLQQQSITHAQG